MLDPRAADSVHSHLSSPGMPPDACVSAKTLEDICQKGCESHLTDIRQATIYVVSFCQMHGPFAL